MKCLRRILNVSRLDKIRNEIIRQRIGVTPVLDYIKKQQLKWFGNVSRYPTSFIIIIERALTLRYNGRRDKGRPRRRWIDDLTYNGRRDKGRPRRRWIDDLTYNGRRDKGRPRRRWIDDLRYNGRRNKGRTRRRWIDDIVDSTANISQQIHHMALSRTLHLHSTQ
jgi:hypothetical protein